MFYYRYRSGSELAMKELMYDELYFTSKEECNDPYEGKIFAKLDANEDLWNQIIHDALLDCLSVVPDTLIGRIVSFFVNKAPIYVDEVLKDLNSGLNNLGQNELEKQILHNVSVPIAQYILQHLPTELYFASFSRRSDNYLLWSHYANNHKGFCLIFRARNGMLQQSSNWQREYVPFAANNNKLPFVFYVPQAFKFLDVEYIDCPLCMDGFSFFANDELRYGNRDKELVLLHEKHIHTYLQKHHVWNYEEETRIVLAAGSPFVTSRKASIPPHYRLFHYEPTQLVGIVLGANMSENQRCRVKDIVSEKVSRWYTNASKNQIPPMFVLFEEHLSESNREVIPEPIEIYKETGILYPTHPLFQTVLDEWYNA